MDEHSAKRRKYARYKTDLEVTVQQEAGAFGGRITQISRGGCLIYPALPAELTPHVKVSFRLSDQLPPINCHGEIVYSIADQGSGVALTEISEYQQDLITQYFEAQQAAAKQSNS
jgi:PilZ domain-containing protein